MYLRMNAAVHDQSFVRDNKAIRLFATHTGAVIKQNVDLDQWLVSRYNEKFPPLFAYQLEVRNRRPKKRRDYYAYIKSSDWQRKRQEVFACLGYKCAKCQATKGIEVHHLTYKNLGHEEIEDLMPLCDKCHQRLHKGKITL